MGFLAALFEPGSPMPWDLGEVPGRKQRRVEDAYDMTSSVEAKYPEDVWAPPADLGRGPASDPYPEPYQFKKRELVSACRQAMKMSGMGGRYPRPWTINGEATDYMAFPILPGQRLWAGGEPGRFRLIYHRCDGTFHRIVMHRYTTPLAGKETTGLGFCLAGENSGQETSHCYHEHGPKLVKSPPASSSPANNLACHPLRQNPPIFKPVPWSPEDVGRTWASPIFEMNSRTVFPEREMPLRLNSVPLPISNYDPPPLVKVKSAPSTSRRPSYGRPLPAELRTTLVKSPPTAMIKSMPKDIPPLPPLEIIRNTRSNAVVPRQLCTIHSPDVSQDGYFVAPSPRGTQHPSLSPTPLVDQNGLFVKIPPSGQRRSSVATSPLVDQNGVVVKSPPNEPRRSSVAISPALDHDRGFARSPQSAMYPLSKADMIPAPLDLQSCRSVKSLAITPGIESNALSSTVGHDIHLSRSPRATSCSFNDIELPVTAERSPTFEQSPTRSPKIKSPVMSPQAFIVMQSPTMGYDPRLPIKSPRSPRTSGLPFSNTQSVILGQQTPLVGSPTIGMHSSKSGQSPALHQDPRLLVSSHVPQITFWTERPQISLSPYA